ncbi:FAD binding domain-containing protein [Peterkaempfera sp. SMS 1(5)a]|uniref:FAD binding domain-containing protein n=1 Tax=Peterkaempfera podocarpi TaxID=3232308 RepID=UPI00366CF988
MKGFDYRRAEDPAAAVATVTAAPGARYLAGGTNLVDLMKLGVEAPDLLVDIGRLLDDRVEETADGAVRIGAGVRNSDLAAHPAVRRSRPALSQALLAGASGQLRNTATVGGNLLQRTRCPYFQDTSKPCNKRDPGSGCPAIDGAHRDLAILGASDRCIATHPSDMAVAMAALDAEAVVLGAAGERTVPVAELYRLPGDHPERETVLAHGDLITEVLLPALPPTARSGYRKARDRASFAFGLASVAAVLEVRDGTVHRVGLAFGAVAARPWRARTAEQALHRAPATAESFARAADAELAAARPLRDNRYKVPLTRNLMVALLTDLTEGAAR